MASLQEVKEFLKKSVEWLKEEDMGCTTLKLDDKLAICVGWLPGYGEEERDDVIQSKSEPDFAINAGIKVWTSDDMRTDYEFINMPYYDGGEVVETDVSIEPKDEEDEYGQVAQWLLDQYDGIKDLNIDDNGLIHEEEVEKTEVETEVQEESLKEEKKSLKETFDGENVIDDLVERAQDKINEGMDADDAVMEAIDEGLIYTNDIIALLEHYGSIDDSTIVESYYDDLYSDILSNVEIPEEKDELDWEDEEESEEGEE